MRARYETEVITVPNPEYNPQRAEEARQKKIYWQKQKVNYKREVNSLLEKMISYIDETVVEDEDLESLKLNSLSL